MYLIFRVLRILITIILLNIHLAFGLVAFDCQNLVNSKSYSLTDTEPCGMFDANNITISYGDYAVLQYPLKTVIHARMCHVLRHVEHIYCSFNKEKVMRVIPENYIGPQNIQITKQECDRMWTTKEYVVQGKASKLYVGITNNILEGGKMSKDGYCANRREEVDVIIYKIRLLEVEVYSLIDPISGVNTIKTQDSELVVPIGKGSGITNDASIFLWKDHEMASCHWELIYFGNMTILSDTKGNQIGLIESLTAGFSIKSNIHKCNSIVQQTSDPYIYVGSAKNYKNMTIRTLTEGHWSTAIKSVTQYILTSLSSLEESNTALLSDAFCKLENTVNLNTLTEKDSNPSEVGYKFMGERGWMVERLGEAVIISKCSEIEVQINASKNCFDKIPISINNYSKLLFLDPLTREISMTASRLQCQSNKLPLLKVRGEWYKFSPLMQTVPPPKPLPTKLHIIKQSLTKEITGLYPSDIINKMEGETPIYHTREEAVNSLLVLANTEMGDSNSPTWEEGGQLFSLASSLISSRMRRIMYISITTMICIVFLIVLFIFIFLFHYWKISNKLIKLESYIDKCKRKKLKQKEGSNETDGDILLESDHL